MTLLCRYSDKRLLGTRDVLGEEDEVQPNGKMFKKLELGDYRWMTYEEVDAMADNFGRGLRTLGQKPEQNLCLFADTRMEWLVAAQASFRQSFPVVTIYTNLGEEAVVHGLVETGVELVITSHELLPRFKKILAGGEDSVKFNGRTVDISWDPSDNRIQMANLQSFLWPTLPRERFRLARL